MTAPEPVDWNDPDSRIGLLSGKWVSLAASVKDGSKPKECDPVGLCVRDLDPAVLAEIRAMQAERDALRLQCQMTQDALNEELKKNEHR